MCLLRTSLVVSACFKAPGSDLSRTVSQSLSTEGAEEAPLSQWVQSLRKAYTNKTIILIFQRYKVSKAVKNKLGIKSSSLFLDHWCRVMKDLNEKTLKRFFVWPFLYFQRVKYCNSDINISGPSILSTDLPLRKMFLLSSFSELHVSLWAGWPPLKRWHATGNMAETSRSIFLFLWRPQEELSGVWGWVDTVQTENNLSCSLWKNTKHWLLLLYRTFL